MMISLDAAIPIIEEAEEAIKMLRMTHTELTDESPVERESFSERVDSCIKMIEAEILHPIYDQHIEFDKR